MPDGVRFRFNTCAAAVLVFACAIVTGDAAAAPPPNGQAEYACLKAGPEADARRVETMELLLDRDPHSTIDGYRKAIRNISARYGPLSVKLVPELLNLGLVYRRSGDFSEASGEFATALHVWRANEGLNNLDQVPIIDLLIDSSTAAHQWKRVGRAYALMYWVYRRNYGPDDPHLLPVLKRLHNWHLKAYNKKTGLSLEEHYRIANQTLSQAERIIDKCTGKPRLALCYLNNRC